MKMCSKIGVFLTLLLFILPFVSADISLNTNDKEVYNLGEKLVISGSVLGTRDMTGILEFTMVCEDKSYQVGAKTINVKLDTSVEFNKEIPLYRAGTCYIGVKFLDVQENKIFESESNDFSVTGELDGQFYLNLKNYQLGDHMSLTGEIKRPDGKEIYGTALIFLKKGDINYIVDSVEVSDGKIVYEKTYENLLDGTYNLYVRIMDNRGDEQLFEIGEIIVEDELIVNDELEKETGTYLPKENVMLKVSSFRKLDGRENKGKLIVKLDNKAYFYDGASEFDFILPLAENIKSGKHTIEIKAEDVFGNAGKNSVDIDIIPVDTRLEFSLDKESYNSNEYVKVKANLYDQAGDFISKAIDLEVYNQEELVFEKTFMSNEETSFNLGSNSGSLVIKVLDGDLIQEKAFSVNPSEGLTSVTGNSIKDTLYNGGKWAGIVLLALIIVGLLYKGGKTLKKPSFKSDNSSGISVNSNYHQEKKLGMQRRKEIQGGLRKEPELKASEDDIKDFRSQMLKRIRGESLSMSKEKTSYYDLEKARERKIDYPKSEPKEEKKEVKGAFSMFD